MVAHRSMKICAPVQQYVCAVYDGACGHVWARKQNQNPSSSQSLACVAARGGKPPNRNRTKVIAGPAPTATVPAGVAGAARVTAAAA